MLPLSERMRLVQSPVIPVVGELIRRHPGTISLGQGVVHFGPPPQAIERAAALLAHDANHKYQAVDGTAELQRLLAAKLRDENGIAVAEAGVPAFGDGATSRIVVTAGGNMAFFNALLAIADAGDEIILQSPYYFNHEMAVAMLGCQSIIVPTTDEYQLDVAAIARAITPRTRAVVTVSPNNPTGAVYPEAALREASALCRRHNVYHIHDEAYEYFVYDGARHYSPGSLPQSGEHTISLYSLSKAYGFAAWRIGYMVIPERLLPAVKKAQDTILICPPVISQEAACGALSAGAEYCRAQIAGLARVRHLVLEELAALGALCHVPSARGAFYFLIRLDTPLEPMAVVERLVREHGVAAIPGTTFGIDRGCTLRIAYGALEAQTVAEGMGRLVRGLKAIVAGKSQK